MDGASEEEKEMVAGKIFQILSYDNFDNLAQRKTKLENAESLFMKLIQLSLFGMGGSLISMCIFGHSEKSQWGSDFFRPYAEVFSGFFSLRFQNLVDGWAVSLLFFAGFFIACAFLMLKTWACALKKNRLNILSGVKAIAE